MDEEAVAAAEAERAGLEETWWKEGMTLSRRRVTRREVYCLLSSSVNFSLLLLV